MTVWQQAVILTYAAVSLVAFIKGYYETINKNNPFGLASRLFFLGIFVWGDAIVIGLFWIIACLAAILIQDWYLFLVITSFFWVVRSAGEVIYWLNEQFSDKHRNSPNTLRFNSFFNGEAIWFAYQIFWQCFLVVSLVTSLYLASLWLNTKF